MAVAVLSVAELAILSSMVHAAGFGHRSSGFAPHFGFGAPVFAATRRAEQFNKSFETGPAPHVYIDDESAELTVTVRAGSSVAINEQSSGSGWMREESSTFNVTSAPDGLRIVRTTKSSTRMMMFGSFRRTLAVTVPPGTRLEVANAGSTDVSGLREGADIHSDNGHVIVSDHRGRLVATSDNGRIELHDVDGPTVTATTDNGRVLLTGVRAGTLSVEADNGRIDGSAVSADGGKIATDNGRINLGLAQDNNITVTAHASSGKVIAKMPLAFDPLAGDGDNDEQPRTLRLGNGTGKLEVSSGNGTITISMGGTSL
jgi:DUF4097 and DUF4098 domain-containing protein YvlB